MFCKLGIVRFKINEAIKSQRNKEKSFVGNMEKVNLKFYIIYIYIVKWINPRAPWSWYKEIE